MIRNEVKINVLRIVWRWIVVKRCCTCKTDKPIEEFGKLKSSSDGYNIVCRECRRSANKKSSRKHADKLAEKRLANKDKKSEYDKRHYAENKENKLQYAKKYYKSNRSKILNYQKEYAKKHKKVVSLYKKLNKHKRRAIIEKSSLKSKEFMEWEKSQRKICSYCNVICEQDYQIDHIDPLSTGGTHELNNLAIVCPSCNRRKSNKSMVVWLAERYKDDKR